MDTIFNAPRHFRLYGAALAMAALLIALLAVTMTAGPSMAQGELEPDMPSNADYYNDPVPCSEEAEPGPDTKEVIDEGYYAVFDAFWDYEVSHLSNNFCPPKVTVVDGFGETTYSRSNADIHISETVFSIDDSYKVTVINTGTGTTDSEVTDDTIDLADFPFLAAENAVSAGNKIWWIRLDEPWTSEDETSPLQIGLSTALLKEEHWHDENGGSPVQIRFAAVHVLKDGSEPEAHVVGAHFFAFDKRETDTEDRDADWSNVQTVIASDIGMETGQYRPMQFAFTKPGVYRVQVNVQGHVRKERPTGHTGEWERISPDDTITSPVQWYTFHVGDLADLGVAVEASDPAPEVETDLTLTVTASNAGPNAAEVTEVQVNLPEGLTYSSHDTASGTYDSATGVWSVGSMEAPTGDDPTEATLTITVSAAANTHGQALETTATILARETIGSSEVLELDPDTTNNTSSATVTPPSAANAAPMFAVERSVPENAYHDHAVGDPVAVVQGDDDDLTYQLTGVGSDKFHVEGVEGGAQIKVLGRAGLDYETVSSYDLVLGVSDGKDANGNADTATDSSIAVNIQVQDVDETVTVNLAVQMTGTHAEFTATVNNLPSDSSNVRYTWSEHNLTDNTHHTTSHNQPTFRVDRSLRIAPIVSDFSVTVRYDDSDGNTHYVESNTVEVVW